MTQARAGAAGAPESLRLDKWLWQARFFRTRGLAAEFVGAGRVRVNSIPVSKPGRTIAPGDVLTFALGAGVRVVRVVDLGLRRGPASEARALYQDLAAAVPPESDRRNPPAAGEDLLE